MPSAVTVQGFQVESPGSSLYRVIVLFCWAKRFAFTMILAISSQLYKYLLTNGQGHLKNVLQNAGEGEGLKF